METADDVIPWRKRGGDSMRTAVASSRPASEPVYNLFRRRAEPELYCAVPEDHAVPAFVAHEDWEYAGKVKEAAEPDAFHRRAARVGVRLSGFYLFQAVHPRHARIPAGWREIDGAGVRVARS
jgi:hypothetical protein